MSYNFSDGHLGFMQIRKVPQSCHSGKRWIWILEALSNTNPSKKLTVPTISGFTMGHPQLATRLYMTDSYPGLSHVSVIPTVSAWLSNPDTYINDCLKPYALKPACVTVMGVLSSVLVP